MLDNLFLAKKINHLKTENIGFIRVYKVPVFSQLSSVI